MQNNRILSTLPSEIFGLSSLNSMDFSNNSIHGPLPTEIGLVNGLDPFCATVGCVITDDGYDPLHCEGFGCNGDGNFISLSLSHNFLNGTLPSELGTMNYIQMLDLSFNDFTGVVPSEIGILNASILLRGNRFSGFLPPEVCWLWCGQTNYSFQNRSSLLEVDCGEGLDCESSCQCF